MTKVINTAPKVILYTKKVTKVILLSETKVIISTEHDKSDKFIHFA